ncbi:MAG: class D sortase [Patescibacteria group bacterium]|nr:class D sortase [Patescibacteria group bacterium]
MPLYSYVKEYPRPRHQFARTFSYVFLTLGTLLMFWSFYPIISFEIYSRLFIEQGYASPVPRSQLASSVQESRSVLGSYDAFSSNLRDFAQASVWFPSRPQVVVSNEITVQEYQLTIPRLNIIGATVRVGADDLSQSLIHYLPTSLPGEYGNVAIFGHSTLPQLYNPKDYKTIFTYLPSLEKGDTIKVTMEGQEYEYEVFEMFVVEPDQVSVLEQRYDNSYLTLITCVPPGTFWNRLVVRAKMKSLPKTL